MNGNEGAGPTFGVGILFLFFYLSSFVWVPYSIIGFQLLCEKLGIKY